MLNIKYQYFKGEAQSNDLFSKLVEAKENVTKHLKKISYILVTLSNHEKLIFLILSSQRNQSQKNAN